MRADCGQDKDQGGREESRDRKAALSAAFEPRLAYLYGRSALPREIFRHQIYRFKGPENLPNSARLAATADGARRHWLAAS
jgi:hypothetical protein